MGKIPNIEIRVNEKTLSMDNRKLNLEDNFIGAKISKILNKPDEIAVELEYLKQEDFSPDDEMEKVYEFVQNKLQKIQVYSYREQDYETIFFPAGSLTGKFNATIFA